MEDLVQKIEELLEQKETDLAKYHTYLEAMEDMILEWSDNYQYKEDDYNRIIGEDSPSMQFKKAVERLSCTADNLCVGLPDLIEDIESRFMFLIHKNYIWPGLVDFSVFPDGQCKITLSLSHCNCLMGAAEDEADDLIDDDENTERMISQKNCHLIELGMSTDGLLGGVFNESTKKDQAIFQGLLVKAGAQNIKFFSDIAHRHLVSFFIPLNQLISAIPESASYEENAALIKDFIGIGNEDQDIYIIENYLEYLGSLEDCGIWDEPDEEDIVITYENFAHLCCIFHYDGEIYQNVSNAFHKAASTLTNLYVIEWQVLHLAENGLKENNIFNSLHGLSDNILDFIRHIAKFNLLSMEMTPQNWIFSLDFTDGMFSPKPGFYNPDHKPLFEPSNIGSLVSNNVNISKIINWIGQVPGAELTSVTNRIQYDSSTEYGVQMMIDKMVVTFTDPNELIRFILEKREENNFPNNF